MHSAHALRRCAKDVGFWTALALGPVCWTILYFSGLTPRQIPIPPSTIFYAMFAYPILEEIVFRGAIQGALLSFAPLKRSYIGISAACLITSLLFAAAHLFNQSAFWAALIILPSLVFGWARERHRTLFSPILLHIVYNAGFIGLFYNG